MQPVIKKTTPMPNEQLNEREKNEPNHFFLCSGTDISLAIHSVLIERYFDVFELNRFSWRREHFAFTLGCYMFFFAVVRQNCLWHWMARKKKKCLPFRIYSCRLCCSTILTILWLCAIWNEAFICFVQFHHCGVWCTGSVSELLIILGSDVIDMKYRDFDREREWASNLMWIFGSQSQTEMFISKYGI